MEFDALVVQLLGLVRRRCARTVELSSILAAVCRPSFEEEGREYRADPNNELSTVWWRTPYPKSLVEGEGRRARTSSPTSSTTPSSATTARTRSSAAGGSIP